MRRSTHSTLRRVAGTSVVVLATVVPAGVAAAADYPNGGNPPTDVQSTGSTVNPATRSQGTSTLPFTGGDVAGLALIGAGAALAGTVMVRRARRPANV